MTDEAVTQQNEGAPDGFRIGATVGGRYALRREIGRGAAASVFAADHLVVRRSVALKVPHRDAEQRDALAARLRRETQALAIIRHPAIVEVIDAWEEQGTPVLAMQLLEGRTLAGLIAARGKLGPHEVVKIGVALAAGLAAVHRAGVIHRDVKPSNVLVGRDPTNQIRLLDFGLARLMNLDPGEKQLTQVGAILGTIEYMAPEALLAQADVDPRADVYSLGVTLYECLTGTVPFEGQLGQVLLKLTTSEPRRLTVARPDVPEPLAAIVHRMIAREPGDRPRTMDDIATELTACASEPLDATDVFSGTRARAEPPPLPRGKPDAAAEAQRKLPRAPYLAIATLYREGGSHFDAKIEDISEGGVLLVAAEACASNEALKLRFALPISGRVVEVPSVARWSRSSRGTRASGVEFQTMGEASRAEIRHYVALMSKDTPESRLGTR